MQSIHLYRRFLLLIILFPAFFFPEAATAQDEDHNPVDTVSVLSQAGNRPYECRHTLIVTNRQPDSIPISQVRIRLLDYNGEFIPGEAGAPGDWSIFLNRRDIQWLSQTFDAEIDSGESLTSFRFSVRDTGVYRIRWETWGPDGLLSFDTLVFACGSRDNCDDVFFSPLPSSNRCGFDIDILNQNGSQQRINDFHVQVLTSGAMIDTVGMRVPAGWQVQSITMTTIGFRTTGDGLSTSEFLRGFRLFTSGGPGETRLVWWTTNFGDEICRDTITVRCGLTVSDTLYFRDAISGDSCCNDLLLLNTHFPRSQITTFRLAMSTPGALFIDDSLEVPEDWTAAMNAAGDTIVISTEGEGLSPGDSLLARGICYDNNLALVDSVRYFWQTLDEGLLATNGLIRTFCRRKIVFCDSVSVQLDSSLTATSRCLTFRLRNENSRRDVIQKFTLRINNPGVMRRIVSATPPSGWSLDRFTNDSVIFHRGSLEPGFSKDGFTFCLNLDTNALDPLKVTWTTWRSEISPICTDSLSLDVGLRIACDTVRITENEESIDPLCCFDVVVRNTNSKGIPIDRVNLAVPRVDIFVDTATAETGNWMVTNAFPSVSVNYLGDTIQPGDSARFTFCVNAAGVPERPFTFRVIWRTYGRGSEICFDTLMVSCEGAEGACDSIYLTEDSDSRQSCSVGYGVDNLHTPDGPIDNVQFTIMEGSATFVSTDATGTAAAFDQVELSPKQVIFRGGTIPAEGSAGNFRLHFSETFNEDIVLEICTFEGDLELCCKLDTVRCEISSVDREYGTQSPLYSLHPNPTTDRLTLSFGMEIPGSATLVLIDAEGREALRYEAGLLESGDHTVSIETSGIPSGSYRFVLQAGKQRAVGGVMIVR